MRKHGARLLESAREAARIERGEIEPARVVRYTVANADVDAPAVPDPRAIRAIRARMRLSQPLFAAALNVSPETVRAWEQGKRVPDGPTLRLLELAEQVPSLFLEKVRERGVGSGAGVGST